MRESDLQTWIVALVESGSLLRAVSNYEEIEEAYATFNGDGLMPFHADYLLRERWLESAHHILPALNDAEIIAATVNISSDRTAMYPDIALFSARSQITLVVELKASEKTEREALTQLIAYDHEIRNHLPFSSNLDQCMIVVATDFGTLLDHAIAGLLVWQQRHILCLRIVGEGEKRHLEVHLPRAWSALGLPLLPPGAIRTVTLALHLPAPHEETKRKALETTIPVALDLLAWDAESAGSHGFAFVWRDETKPGSFALTVAVMSPYAFLEWAIRTGSMKSASDAITKWYTSKRADLNKSPASLVLIVARARNYLQRFCKVDSEELLGWEDSWAKLRRRGHVLQVEFWGTLGKHARYLFLNPFFAKELGRDMGAPSTWRSPIFAIPLIHELCGTRLFHYGRFTLGDVFRFGNALSALVVVCRAISKRESHPLEPLPALMQWSTLTLIPTIREILIRCYCANIEPPPNISLGGPAKAKETEDSVKRLIAWFDEQFLRDNATHRRWFALGLMTYALFDECFSGIEENERAAQMNLVREGAVELIQFILLGTEEGDWDLAGIGILREDLKMVYGIEFELTDEAVCADLLDSTKYNCAAHLKHLPALFILAEEVVPPVFHRLGQLVVKNNDWSFVRAELDAARERGVPHPGICITEDGTVALVQFLDFAVDTTSVVRIPDPGKEALVAIEKMGGLTHIAVVRWDDLSSGRSLQEARARSIEELGDQT